MTVRSPGMPRARLALGALLLAAAIGGCSIDSMMVASECGRAQAHLQATGGTANANDPVYDDCTRAIRRRDLAEKRAAEAEQAEQRAARYNATAGPAELQAELAKVKIALAGQPSPRDRIACSNAYGTWYAKCTSWSGKKCIAVSSSDGVCSDFVMPDVMDGSTCGARQGRFGARCAEWAAAGSTVKCIRNASYGTCRDQADIPHLYFSTHEGRLYGGSVATKPTGMTRARVLEQLETYYAHRPAPKDYPGCQRVSGTWYGECTKFSPLAHVCRQTSRTAGVCGNYIVPRYSSEARCTQAGLRFQPECLAREVFASGTEGKCVLEADFGYCRKPPPSAAGRELYQADYFGRVVQDPNRLLP
jgi:hypothetical protein